MTDERATDPRRDELLAALLVQPAALLTAIAPDGHMVAAPPSLDLPADRLLPPPGARSTMLDIVLPGDALTMIGAWEKVLAHGWAFATVHMRATPDVPCTLTFVDVRAQHGVLVGALEVQAGDAADEAPPTSAHAPVARRPRTAVVHKNGTAVFTSVDERTTRMLGWTAEEMVGRRSSDFIHAEDQDRAIGAWLELLAGQQAHRVRLRHRRADGEWLWLELDNQYRPADDPADAVVVTEMTDISDEMAAQEALQRQEQLLRRVAESLPVGIIQLDRDGRLVYANDRLAQILDIPAGSGSAELLGVLADEDRAAVEAALAQALDTGADEVSEPPELEVTVRHGQAGEPRVCAVTVTRLGDREGAPGALISVNDVTERVRLRDELTVQATYDALTGVHNRASVMSRLEQFLAADRDGTTAVVFLDLDGFKSVNDTLGHSAGDEVLVVAAQRISGALRHEDVVGRLGGDEFLVISRGAGSPESAMALAGRVRDALLGPVQLAEGRAELRASIGVARAEPGMSATALVGRADEAMYRSKQARDGRPVLHAG